MNTLFRTILAAVALAVTAPVGAAPDAKATREIDHLLAFVAASECKFLRAGSEYDGKAARDHLARKLDYARSRLATADQFVEHVATGSSMTGEAYKVRCGARELTSKAWLRGELDAFRKTGSK